VAFSYSSLEIRKVAVSVHSTGEMIRQCEHVIEKMSHDFEYVKDLIEEVQAEHFIDGKVSDEGWEKLSTCLQLCKKWDDGVERII
jgi:hypothetical protein